MALICDTFYGPYYQAIRNSISYSPDSDLPASFSKRSANSHATKVKSLTLAEGASILESLTASADVARHRGCASWSNVNFCRSMRNDMRIHKECVHALSNTQSNIWRNARVHHSWLVNFAHHKGRYSQLMAQTYSKRSMLSDPCWPTSTLVTSQTSCYERACWMANAGR